MNKTCNCGNGGMLFHVALVLVVVGALNWGLVGAFNFDLVSTIFGDGSILSRIIFVLVGISALWSLTLFKGCRNEKSTHNQASHDARSESVDSSGEDME